MEIEIISDFTGLGDLVEEIKQATAVIEGDNRFNKRLDGFEQKRNELYRRAGRPGASTTDDDVSERKDAAELCRCRRSLTVPKIDAGAVPKQRPKTAWPQGLRRSLQIPAGSRPTRDPTDLSGPVDRLSISSGAIQFPIDNSRMSLGGWACDANCFANNPASDLQDGLGTLEIKAEQIRYVQCATADLLQDAACNVEQLLIDKVSRGIRDTINAAIVAGRRGRQAARVA